MTARRIGLVLANLALGAGLWLVLTEEPDAILTQPAPRPLAGAPLPSPVTPAALPAGRSFFRSPVTEPARTASIPAPPVQPKLRLVGVLLLDGRHVGLVEIEGAGTRRVTEGDTVAGWTVAAIRVRELTLAQGERHASYRLDAPAERR